MKTNFQQKLAIWGQRAQTFLYYGWAPFVVILAIRSAMKPMTQAEKIAMQGMMG